MTNPRQDVSAAAIVRMGESGFEIFSARRTEPAHLIGWEFPGGKWDPGEDGLLALHREISEELGVFGLNVLAKLPGNLPDGAWAMGTDYAMHVYVCTLPVGTKVVLQAQHDLCQWVPLADPYQVDWLEVDRPVVDALASWLQEAERLNYPLTSE